MKYRLYIDETGDPSMGQNIQDDNHRYLGLTGVIINLDEVRDNLKPGIEEIKKDYFEIDPDVNVILHRKEIVQRKGAFRALTDPEIQESFDDAILKLLEDINYTIITVGIDKLEHKEKYLTWRFEPYHYCLAVLMERFCMFLNRKGAKGDVKAESRGGREDTKLKASFTRLYENGTDFIKSEEFADVLTSKQLKIKPKSANIAGLQLADLLAHPSMKYILSRHRGIPLSSNTFQQKVIDLLINRKYHRMGVSNIVGYGIKLLP